MEDGKRETAVSMLPIIPEDSDSGRTYTCRVLNPAAPAGRQTSVTINVQRESSIHLPTNTQRAACSHQCSVETNECFCKIMHVSDMNVSASHRPPFSDSVSPASDCNRGSQGSLHLLCLSQSWNHWIQVSVFSVSTLNVCVALRHKSLIKWIL